MSEMRREEVKRWTVWRKPALALGITQDERR